MDEADGDDMHTIPFYVCSEMCQKSVWKAHKIDAHNDIERNKLSNQMLDDPISDKGSYIRHMLRIVKSNDGRSLNSKAEQDMLDKLFSDPNTPEEMKQELLNSVQDQVVVLQSANDEVCTMLAKHLSTNTHVKGFHAYDCGLGDRTAIALADMLLTNTTITSLIFQANKFTDVGVKAIAESLKVNTTLECLSISANEFSDQGAQAILHAIRDYNCTLTECRLKRDMLGTIAPGLTGDQIIRTETDNEITTLCQQNKHAAGTATQYRREHVEANKRRVQIRDQQH